MAHVLCAAWITGQMIQLTRKADASRQAYTALGCFCNTPQKTGYYEKEIMLDKKLSYRTPLNKL